MVEGVVYDIMRYALHDGPGIRTTVFFKGCPLTCKWCANPESQAPAPEFIFFSDKCLGCNACITACDENAISVLENGYKQVDPTRCSGCKRCVEECYTEALRLVGRSMTVEDVMDEVMKDQAFYLESGGGVTFSGGDPLFQSQFLTACLGACKAKKLHTVVETAGVTTWETLDVIRPLVDQFLFDLKVVAVDDHRALTGVSNIGVLDNLKKLVSCHNVIVRIPIIPDINDHGTPWKEIQAFLENLPWRGRIDMLPYHRMGLGKYTALNRPYSLDPDLVLNMEKFHDCQRKLIEAGFTVQIPGAQP